MRATARLSLIRPHLERLSNRMKESDMDPQAMQRYQQEVKALFKEHKTSPFSPMVGALVQAPLFIGFFFAIQGMAAGVPSFAEGGALWFKDLSTPDPFYIMPTLSGLSFLATVELGATEGMEGHQATAARMKNLMQLLAVAMIPLTASFSKATFCYWLTTNAFSLVQTAVLKNPGVRAAVGIPKTAHLASPSPPPKVNEQLITLSRPPRRTSHQRDTRKIATKHAATRQ
eukprot:SM000220S07049  [mRNA]  locus=s220:54933:56823:- [translate_table: standard]